MINGDSILLYSASYKSILVTNSFLNSSAEVTLYNNDAIYYGTWNGQGFLFDRILEYGVYKCEVSQGLIYGLNYIFVDSSYKIVELSLKKRLYLYKKGDQCTDVTGGWFGYNYPIISAFTYAYPTFNSTNISFVTEDESVSRAISTNNSIDVTNYARCILEVDYLTDYPEISPVRYGFRTSKTGTYEPLSGPSGRNSLPASATELNIDLVDISGNYYMLVGTHVANTYLTVYNIYLEANI